MCGLLFVGKLRSCHLICFGAMSLIVMFLHPMVQNQGPCQMIQYSGVLFVYKHTKLLSTKVMFWHPDASQTWALSADLMFLRLVGFLSAEVMS